MFVAATNRGGFLAVLAALLVVGALEPAVAGRRLVAYGMTAVAAAAVIVLLSVSLRDTSQMGAVTEERALSPAQVVENIVSIVGRESQRGNLSSTKEWRLDWWRTIVDYTFFGRYFWMGKGFGINLADDDGFQVATEDQAPLRSPHNAYMTVLARMGVPGIVLWVALQICFALSLVRAYFRARHVGALWWARLNLWILGYWCAFLVNASFDVFLEGPQGGIWFWSLLGLGVAALEVQRRDMPTAPLARAAR
jgi:O-antigen ligase